jgi:hypothetical protein
VKDGDFKAMKDIELEIAGYGWEGYDALFQAHRHQSVLLISVSSKFVLAAKALTEYSIVLWSLVTRFRAGI